MAEQHQEEPTPQTILDRHLQKTDRFIDYYQVNQFKVATIVQVNTIQKTFKIRLDGYMARNDEIIKFNDPKQERFRKHTNGYTGPKLNANRAQWSPSIPKIKELTVHLSNFLSLDLNHYQAQTYNQLFRGLHFLYADFLMTQTFLSAEILAAAISYLHQHLNFAKKYFKQCDSKLLNFQIEGFPQLEHILCAYSYSYHQIFETLVSIFGGCSRTSLFLKNNKPLFQQIHQEFMNKERLNNQDIIQHFFVKYFLQEGILDAFMDMIQRLELSKCFTPFSFLKPMLAFYNIFSRLVENEKIQKFSAQIYQFIISNISLISQKNIRDISRGLIADTLRRLKVLFIDDTEKLTQIQRSQISVCKKLFSSIKLEHKISAFYYLNEIIQKIKSTVSSQYKYLDQKSLFDECQQSGLLKQMLNQNNHPQIIKRGTQLLVSLCKLGKMTIEVFDMVWEIMETTQDKFIHGLMSLCLEQMISQLQDFPVVTQFYKNKLKSVGYEQWDQTHLKLVHTYLKQKGNQQQIQDLYQYILVTNNQHQIKSLEDIISDHQQQRQYFVNLCFSKIQKQQQVQLHVNLLKELIMSQKSLPHKDQYKQIVIESILNSANSDAQNLLVQKLDLLNYLRLSFDNMNLTQRQFVKIYTSLKPYPKNFKNLMNFMIEQQKNEKKVNPILEDIKQYIFDQILCQMPLKEIQNIDYDTFEVFAVYFIDLNLCTRNLIKMSKKYKLVNPELRGLAKLEEIFLYSQKQDVIKESCQLICDLHMKMGLDLEPYKKDFQTKLAVKITQILKQAHLKKNYQIVQRCLFFLNKFMIMIDGKPEAKQPVYLSQNVLILFIQNIDTKQIKGLRINEHQTLQKLKEEVALLFKKEDCTVTLHQDNNTITSKSNQKPLCEIFINESTIQAVIKDKPPNPVKISLVTDYNFLTTLFMTPVAEQVWKLLRAIPLPIFVTSLYENSLLQSGKKLQSNNIYQLLHTIQILEKFQQNWWQEFIARGHMVHLLSKLSSPITGPLQCRFLFILLNVIFSHYLQTEISQSEKVLLCSNVIAAYKSFINYMMDKVTYHLTQQHEYQQRIARHFFGILKAFGMEAEIFKNGIIQYIIKYGFIGPGNQNQNIKSLISSQMIQMVSRIQGDSIKQFISKLFGEWFQLVIQTHICMNTSYFTFLASIITVIDTQTFNLLMEKHPHILNKIIDYFRRISPQPLGLDMQYNITNGFVMMIKQFVARPQITLTKQYRLGILHYLTFDCLFNDKDFNSKCRYYSTRLNVFKLILELTKPYPDLMSEFLKCIQNIFKKGAWRRSNPQNWEIAAKSPEKVLRYTGIANLGCICYMNSFIQQLFMISSFRQSILACQDPQSKNIDKNQNLLWQLKCLFINLKITDRIAINPSPFCHAFKDFQGNPIDIHQQMDIDEFSSVLFDKLQNQTKGTQSENIIKNHFGGTFSNQIICKDCPHFSEREESFLSIPLQVKSDLHESFQQMVTGQNLEGQNAYFCDKCNKKVNSTKRVCIKTLPNHLILVLKRIQFNYTTFTKHKINDKCEFPFQLNLKPYSDQSLRTHNPRQNESSRQQAQQQPIQKFPDQYFEYELKGVVVHLGYADNGHYYSFIQERENEHRWYEFNDHYVSQFDVNSLPQQTFGSSGQKTRDRNKNAYILIYDRKNKFVQKQKQKQKEKQKNMSNGQVQKYEDPQCLAFQKYLQEQNRQNRMKRLIFTRDLQDFCFKDLMNIVQKPSSNPHPQNILKFVICYYLTVYIRKIDNQNSSIYITMIQTMVYQHSLQNWILELFSTKSLLKQLFMTNSDDEQIKKYLAVLISNCYKKSYDVSKDQKLDTRQRFVYSVRQILEDKVSIKKYETDELFFILQKVIQTQQQIIHSPKELLIKLVQSIDDDKQNIQIQQNTSLFNDVSPYLGCIEDRLDLNYESADNTGPLYRIYTYGVLLQLLKLVGDLSSWDEYKFSSLKNQFNLIPTKAGVNYITDYLSTLALNQEASEWLIGCFKMSFPKCSLNNIRHYMILYKKLISIQDDLQKSRITELTRCIYETLYSMNSNDGVYIDQDVIEQWLIKIARSVQPLRQFLAEMKINFISILKNKEPAPDSVLKKNMKITNSTKYGLYRIQHMIHGLEFPTTKKEYRDLTLSKINDFQNIQILEPQSWDSYKGFADKHLYKNQKVSVFCESQNAYKPGVIKYCSMQHLTITLGSEQQVCFCKDSDNVAQYHDPSDQDTERLVDNDIDSKETNHEKEEDRDSIK